MDSGLFGHKILRPTDTALCACACEACQLSYLALIDVGAFAALTPLEWPRCRQMAVWIERGVPLQADAADLAEVERSRALGRAWTRIWHQQHGSA